MSALWALISITCAVSIRPERPLGVYTLYGFLTGRRVVHVQATGLPMPTRAALVNDKEWHRSNLCSEVTPDFGTSFHLYGPMALVSTAVGALSAPHGRRAPWFRLDESSSSN